MLLGDSAYAHPIVGGGEGANRAILDGVGFEEYIARYGRGFGRFFVGNV